MEKKHALDATSSADERSKVSTLEAKNRYATINSVENKVSVERNC